MTDMTERVARAIARLVPFDDSRWAEGHGHDFPDEYLPAEQSLIRGIARTAIEAMREPTDEMVVAGLNAGYEHNRPKADRLRGDDPSFERCAASLASHVTAGDGTLYKVAYRAMIDAALTPDSDGRAKG